MENDLAEMAKFSKKGANFRPGSIRLEDVDSDYKITEEDKQILGSVRPKFVASMISNLEFEGPDLSVSLYTSAGGLLRSSIEFMEKPGRGSTVKVDYWTSINPTNALPRPSVNVEKLDYIFTLGYDKVDLLKIRGTTLGYTLPEMWSKKMLMDKIRIYLGADNPAMFTNFTGVGPEGANGRTTPSHSTQMFGINLSM